MIRRVLFWPAFVALLVLFLFGLASQRLFAQQVWMPEGLVRLAWFGGAYGAWALAVLSFKPRWFVRATLAAAFIGTAILAGVQAPLAVLFLFASAWAMGRLCGLDGVLALLAGLSLCSLLIGFAVLLPVNYPVVYAVAFAVPLVLQRGRLLELWRAEDVEPKGRWALAALGFVLLMHLAVVLGPEVSADGLAMHLAIPASIHAHHQWTFDVRETAWAVFPMAGDWGFTAAYILGGEAAARLFSFGMLLSAAFLVFRLSRRVLPAAPALLSAALFASSPMVQLVTGSLFIENYWAAMLMGAVTAMVRYEENGERRDALTAAVLLGAALAAKYGTLAYLAPTLILLGLELRRRRALRLFAAIVALILLFGAPPYLGALVQTGNPVFPFFNHIFKSPYFESGAPFVDARFPTPSAIPALFDLTFRTARHFEGQNGGWTFYCFLFAPLAVLLLRPRRADPGWMATAVGIPAAVLALASQGNVRYLCPVLPLCTVAAAAVLADLKQRGVVCYRATLAAAVTLLALNVYFMPASGGYHKQFFVFGRDHVESYLAHCAPVRKVVAWLNEKHPGEPVVFIETNQIAGLTGRALTTTWHNAAFYSEITAAGTPQQSLDTIRQLGIRLIVAPAAANQVSHVALRRMVTGCTRPEFSYAGWQVRTPTEGPPSALPPAVLPRGTYDDLDPRIEYLGRWDSGRFDAAANGSITYSNGPGDLLRVAFQGTGIAWTYTKAFNRGLAEVRIDGNRVGVVDLYSKQPLWRTSSRFAGLAAGAHVLEVRVLGTKAAAATDCFIDVDALVVE